jgi:hypothetical protein
MKQTAGIITALAVVLAIFGVSNLPKSSTGGPGSTQTESGTKASKGRPSTESPGPYGPCVRIQKRLQPFVAETPQEEWKLPAFCYPDSKVPNDPEVKAKGLEFVIATVPNPTLTHLPLMFDRLIEIMQQAAQDNQYSYDSSWLPWSEGKEYTRLPDQQAADDLLSFQESQPGILVFRSSLNQQGESPYKAGLAVFVVSELPTGGINQGQFDNALAWMERLGALSPERELRILGPTFSGSLPSLYRSLHFSRLRPFEGTKKIRVSSGSVSSDSYYYWFKGKLESDQLGTFETAMEGDSVLVDRFCQYIDSQQFRTDRVAFLSEDETAFGTEPISETDTKYGKHFRAQKGAHESKQGVCTYSGGPTYLYYPRDIASLRSAYEKQSIFTAGKQSANANNDSTTLRGDLSEPTSSEHDTVRTYGGQLTPLAQESVLIAITDVLKEKKIDFVVLRSTNTLDQIFLSQFLRRSFPDTRIVIDGADQLFRRGAEGSSLRGVMALSPYPLLNRQQDWNSAESQWSSGESYRIFGADVAEGLYVAARGLFPDRGSKVQIANYAPPAFASGGGNGDDDRPATWLTVIGHRQFWPVAVLNSNTLNDSKAIPILQTFLERTGKANAISARVNPIEHLPIEFWILLIVFLFWSLLHELWCLNGSVSPRPEPFRLAYFAPLPRWQQSALVGFGSLLVAGGAVVVAASSGLLEWQLGSWNAVVAAFLLIVLLQAYFACAGNYRLPAMTDARFTELQAKDGRRISGGVSALCFVLFVLLHIAILHHLRPSNSIPAFWRSVHLLSGVSPLLPQLILFGGMYCWFWFNLRGLSLFGDDRPLLPGKAELILRDEKQSRVMPMFSFEQAQLPTEDSALPIGKQYLVHLGLIFPVVAIICAVVLQGAWLRTLGELIFGRYVFFWLMFCIAMVLADTAQSWMTWLRLRELLLHLDRLPVRRTLYALQGLSWRSVWAMSGNVLTERYSLVSRQIEALRHLQNQVAGWKPTETAALANQKTLLDTINVFEKNELKEFVDWYVSLDGAPVTSVKYLEAVQKEIASIAAFTMSAILIPSWRTEKDSLIFDRSRKPNAASEESGGPVISSQIAPHVLAAEEFFVLPYVGFIQNILGRIRTIVLGSLWLFVATTLAVSSYPFDPLPTLGGIFLVVFAIVGSTMILIYAQMHRDATLSYITGSEPGELGGEFWRQLFTFGVGPLLGLLTTLFPSITDFVVSWLQPSSQAIK